MVCTHIVVSLSHILLCHDFRTVILHGFIQMLNLYHPSIWK